MDTGRLRHLAFILALATMASAAACSFVEEEEAAEGRDSVVDEAAPALRSTLVLDTGCVAAKVGPRHLLLAARCVVDAPEIAQGKTIAFTVASELASSASEDEAPASKESDDKATIEEVVVHPSYKETCKGDRCALGAVGASHAKDIAVILLDAPLEGIPTVPIDLDPVAQGDALLVVGSGCEALDGTPRELKTFKTRAASAEAAAHAGSPYLDAPASVTRLDESYVVTPGVGWRTTEPRVCEADLGAPLVRGGQVAVAGITSNVTTYEAAELAPVTLHHTKVDEGSTVGTWLESLGVVSTRSCSESVQGCVVTDYDGGRPGAPKDGDAAAGEDAGDEDGGVDDDDAIHELPDQGEETELPPSNDDSYRSRGTGDVSNWDAGPRKKKKTGASGCSAAPGSSPSGDGLALVLGLALTGAALRRRS